MQIWPAIDLRGGNCVRLEQGDYNRETVFSGDPIAMAQHWADAGAKFLHLVDLDGARDGSSGNADVVAAIVKQVRINCELGGGVRDEEAIRFWLDVGVARLVIGTKALKDQMWFREMCARYPGRLALGLDARKGFVATDGWLETSAIRATQLAQQFVGSEIAAIVYTDIARDGMMSGPNFMGIAEMKGAISIPVIASGGVTSADDVQRLASIGVEGCIIGRSLYEGKLTIADALRAAEESSEELG